MLRPCPPVSRPTTAAAAAKAREQTGSDIFGAPTSYAAPPPPQYEEEEDQAPPPAFIEATETQIKAGFLPAAPRVFLSIFESFQTRFPDCHSS